MPQSLFSPLTQWTNEVWIDERQCRIWAALSESLMIQKGKADETAMSLRQPRVQQKSLSEGGPNYAGLGYLGQTIICTKGLKLPKKPLEHHNWYLLWWKKGLNSLWEPKCAESSLFLSNYQNREKAIILRLLQSQNSLQLSLVNLYGPDNINSYSVK